MWVTSAAPRDGDPGGRKTGGVHVCPLHVSPQNPSDPLEKQNIGIFAAGGAPRASWGLWGDTQGSFPIPVDPWGSRPLPGGFLCTPKVRSELGCSSKRWGGGEESGGGNGPPRRVHRLNLCPKGKLKAWIKKEIKAVLSQRGLRDIVLQEPGG